MDWIIGDVAQCKAGGPRVVIKNVGREGILCEWIDGDGRYQSGSFAPTSLETPEMPDFVTV